MNQPVTDPAASASKAYRTLARQFADAGEKDRKQWPELDALMKSKYTDDQRKAMWAALDNQTLECLPEEQRKTMLIWREYGLKFSRHSERENDGHSANTKSSSGPKRSRWILGAIALLLLLIGWAVRWQVVETHPASGPASAFLINRWTGEVRYLFNGSSDRVAPP